MSLVKHKGLEKVRESVFIESTTHECSTSSDIRVDVAQLRDRGDEIISIWNRLTDVLDKVPIGVFLEDSHVKQSVHQNRFDRCTEFNNKKIITSKRVQNAIRDRHPNNVV